MIKPANEQFFELTFDLVRTVLEGREPLEGVDIEGGRPTLSTRSMSGTMQVKMGWWVTMPIYAAQETGECMVLILRLDPFDPRE